jgi:hypothetical protein
MAVLSEAAQARADLEDSWCGHSGRELPQAPRTVERVQNSLTKNATVGCEAMVERIRIGRPYRDSEYGFDVIDEKR